MENLTLQELHRNLSDHVKYESEYQTRFEEKLDAILLQVTRTNGRVNSLEIWREKEAHPIVEDYKDNRSQAKGALKLWTIIWGTVLTGVSVAGALYINKIKTDTADTTISRLQHSTFKIEETKKGTDIYSIKIYEEK
jgi:hypothetical protein